MTEERELLGVLKVDHQSRNVFTLLIAQDDEQPSVYYLSLGDLRRLKAELERLVSQP